MNLNLNSWPAIGLDAQDARTARELVAVRKLCWFRATGSLASRRCDWTLTPAAILQFLRTYLECCYRNIGLCVPDVSFSVMRWPPGNFYNYVINFTVTLKVYSILLYSFFPQWWNLNPFGIRIRCLIKQVSWTDVKISNFGQFASFKLKTFDWTEHCYLRLTTHLRSQSGNVFFYLIFLTFE